MVIIIPASLILPATNDIPTEFINYIIDSHRQTIPLDIVVTNQGVRSDKNQIHARVVERHYDGDFNLSKSRNAAAWTCNTEWLIFSDIDTLYENDLFERLISLGHDAVAGKTRRDVYPDGTYGSYYHCGFAPLLIKRKYFESVGGYREKFKNYGYDDSWVEQKINAFDYNSKASHIRLIHDRIASNSEWKRGDGNRDQFFDEMKAPLEARIAEDRQAYLINKAESKL